MGDAIAAASIQMSTNAVMEQVNLAMLCKVKDMSQQNMAQILDMAPATSAPRPQAGSPGHIIDFKA